MVGGDDLGGRARGHGVAVGDEQGVGGGARKFLEVMGDQDRGDLGVGVIEGVDGGEQLFAGGQVEPGGGFVQE